MRRVVPLLAVALVLAACDEDVPTDIAPPPNQLIQDANQNGGNPAFFWLNPIVENNLFSGEFNAQLKPRVSICRLDLTLDPVECDASAPLLATWTVSTGLLVEERQYHVDWDTDETPTDFTATYRIQVFLHELASAELLGVADVEFVSNAQELRNINTDEFIPLGEERTLGIRFRIEKGVSCAGETDCGEATIGPSGGTVTTETGEAGVAIPAGAVDGDLLVKIRKVDPAAQPWGRCLPTGLRQVEGCYEFDTEPAISAVQESGLDQFNEDVIVAVCPEPDAREDYLLLHKYDPEKPDSGVVELDGAAEDFLTCPEDIGAAPGGFLGYLARAGARVLAPVTALIGPKDLWAKDAGRGGVTDAFSFVGWAEPVDLSLAGSLPVAVLPSTAVSASIQATTEHNHSNDPLDASGHSLRFDYTDPASVEDTLPSVVTGANGQAAPAWTLTSAVGVHALDVSTRMEIEVDEAPFLVPDPTPILTLMVGGYTSADACEETETDCGQAVVGPSGDTLTTENGFAGVAIPPGALDGPVLVTIQRVDPDGQPWGNCLPTGLRQEEGCYQYDTEPALSAVNDQDAFNDNVVVAVCVDPGAVREDYLALHKYDPENPLDGVVELPGADENFLTCDEFASMPNGFLGRLARAGRRALSPVLGAVAPKPLYAKDAGRGGVTDAFSFIGWAEPVALSLTTDPDGTVDGITDVVVTALTAHNHEGFPATAADGHTIRFEYIDPSNNTTVTEVVTSIVGGAAEARISLTAQGGTHNVKVSTQQEILIDEDLLVFEGGGAGFGAFGAPRVSITGMEVPFVVPDPTLVVESDPITVLGLVSRWDADGDDPLADQVGPNHMTAHGFVDATAAGVDGTGLYFDGTGGFTDGPAQSIGGAAQFTVSAWVRLDPEGDPQAIQRFVTIAGDAGEKAVLRQEMAPESDARQAHFYGGFGPDPEGTGADLVHIWESNALVAGCWQHLAGTYDGTQLSLYIDGEHIASTPVPLEDRDDNHVADHVSFSSSVAGDVEFPEAFHGTIDEVEVHNYPLSEAEIAALANLYAPACALATGAVSGLVDEALTGLGIPGADVSVLGVEAGAVTNADGFYQITNLPAGDYTLEAGALGYHSETGDVAIVGGETAGLGFTLWPALSLGGGTNDPAADTVGNGPDLLNVLVTGDGRETSLSVRISHVNGVPVDGWVQWVLDLDENPATGYQPNDTTSSDSFVKAGGEVLVTMDGGTVTVHRWTGSAFVAVDVDLSRTISDDGLSRTYTVGSLPNAVLQDDGLMRVRVVSSGFATSGGIDGIPVDFAPDEGWIIVEPEA